MSLRTNYKDDVFSGNRKYTMTNNPDGTVSFSDQTEYTQVGDSYGAAQINETNDIVNQIDANAFRRDDSAETAIADNDYFPFFDTSASARKKTLWSNIKTVLTNVFAIKVHNSNSAASYGAGNATYFGHVKLSDSYTTSAGGASSSVGASSLAVKNAYTANKALSDANTSKITTIEGELTANGKRIYMDYKNGRYGYNTSANRGADTFFPFRAAVTGTFSVDVLHHAGSASGGFSSTIQTMKMSGDGVITLTISQISNYRDSTEAQAANSKSASISFANNTKGTSMSYSRDANYVYQENVSGKTLAYSDGDVITITASATAENWHVYARFYYTLS